MAGEEILKFPYKIKSSLKHSEKSVEKNCLLPLKKEGISWYVFHDHFRFSCGKKHRRFLGSKYFSSDYLYITVSTQEILALWGCKYFVAKRHITTFKICKKRKKVEKISG